MQTISEVGKQFGLSRSTLLYYDRLKLVRPTYRTAAGYRLYSAEECARLKRICSYRQAGMPLAEIGRLLEEDKPSRTRLSQALHRRLTALNHEIAALRRQQQVVLSLLPEKGQDHLARAMTKEKWVALLRSQGMSDAEMMQWHAAFEHQTPLAHQDFLESLGLPPDEIKRIRARSSQLAKAAAGGRNER